MSFAPYRSILFSASVGDTGGGDRATLSVAQCYPKVFVFGNVVLHCTAVVGLLLPVSVIIIYDCSAAHRPGFGAIEAISSARASLLAACKILCEVCVLFVATASVLGKKYCYYGAARFELTCA